MPTFLKEFSDKSKTITLAYEDGEEENFPEYGGNLEFVDDDGNDELCVTVGRKLFDKAQIVVFEVLKVKYFQEESEPFDFELMGDFGTEDKTIKFDYENATTDLPEEHSKMQISDDDGGIMEVELGRKIFDKAKMAVFEVTSTKMIQYPDDYEE